MEDSRQQQGSPSTTVKRKQFAVIEMFKKKDNFVAAANKNLEVTRVSRDISTLSSQVDALRVAIGTLQGRLDKQERLQSEMLERVSRSEQDAARGRAELSVLQQQIEGLSLNFERERGTIAEHTDHLRFLSGQARKWQHDQGDEDTSSAKYWAVAGWLYPPLLSLIKGLWFIFYPILVTFQQLTIFSVMKSSSSSGEDEADNKSWSDIEDQDDLSSPAFRAQRRRKASTVAGIAGGVGQSPSGGSGLQLLDMLQSGVVEDIVGTGGRTPRQTRSEHSQPLTSAPAS